MIEHQNGKIRDGKGFCCPVKTLSCDEWTIFENKPSADDPNLIIEEIESKPEPAKKKRRKKAAPKIEKAPEPVEEVKEQEEV